MEVIQNKKSNLIKLTFDETKNLILHGQIKKLINNVIVTIDLLHLDSKVKLDLIAYGELCDNFSAAESYFTLHLLQYMKD